MKTERIGRSAWSKPGFVLLMAASLGVSVGGPTAAQPAPTTSQSATPAEPSQADPGSPSSSLEKPPASKKGDPNAEDPMGILVELPHPVSADSAKSLITPAVTALVVQDETLFGELFLRQDESPASAVSSLKTISTENFGGELRVSGVRLDPAAANQVDAVKLQAAELPAEAFQGDLGRVSHS